MGTTIFLIIIGVAIIFLNVRAIEKEKHSFKASLNNADFDMNEVDVRIGELRRAFTEDIAELQIEIEELKEAIHKGNMLKVKETDSAKNNVKNKEKKESNKKIDKNESTIVDNKVKEINENVKTDEKKDKFENSKGNENKNVKINEVSMLLGKGLTTDEVSQKLGISKGEVLLIKELYLK